ncbi:MAG: hypothetical protein RL754_940 [Bacteroidota bacterium]
MKTLTESEENYIKALYYLGDRDAVSNGDLATRIGAKGSSVTQAVKRLALKSLVEVVPYRGVRLTEDGRTQAIHILRKHRLWETFLVEKLGFGWEEVHPIAEQLEHVQSPELVRRLAAFLGSPESDPHGDPIPHENGHVPPKQGRPLSVFEAGQEFEVVRVEDAGSEFFSQLDSLQIALGNTYTVKSISAFDKSIELERSEGSSFWLSSSMSNNIYANPTYKQS